MASFAHWQCVSLIAVAGLMACGSAEPELGPPAAGTGGAGSGGMTGAAAVGGIWSGGTGGSYAGAAGWSAGGAGSSGTTAGQSGSAGRAAGSGGSSGAAGATTSGASGSAAGGGGASGSSGSSAEATEFCTDYQTHCGFGAAMRYTNSADCTTKYAAWTTTRQMCIEMHLGFVIEKLGTADYEPYKTMHCPHATGLAPCAAAP